MKKAFLILARDLAMALYGMCGAFLICHRWDLAIPSAIGGFVIQFTAELFLAP